MCHGRGVRSPDAATRPMGGAPGPDLANRILQAWWTEQMGVGGEGGGNIGSPRPLGSARSALRLVWAGHHLWLAAGNMLGPDLAASPLRAPCGGRIQLAYYSGWSRKPLDRSFIGNDD